MNSVLANDFDKWQDRAEIEECARRCEAAGYDERLADGTLYLHAARLLRAAISPPQEPVAWAIPYEASKFNGIMFFERKPNGNAIPLYTFPPTNGRLHQTNAPDPQASGNNPSEPPAQSALAQEPVAWQYVDVETHKETLTAQPPDRVADLHRYEYRPLYAAPPQDEARELLREAMEVIEGVADQQAMPDDWYMVKLERIRAYLEKRP